MQQIVKDYITNSSKILVYTSIFGGYDSIKSPKCKNPNFDYICFTDREYTSTWNIRIIDPGFDNCRNARFIKTNIMNICPEYDYYIWVDGSMLLVSDLGDIVNTFIVSDNDGLFVKHPIRNCIYDEYSACMKLKKANEDEMFKQMKYYKSRNFQRNRGLVESNFFIIKNNDPNKKLFGLWWDEIKTRSPRDQLSFNYVLYNSYKITYIQDTERNKLMKWDKNHN